MDIFPFKAIRRSQCLQNFHKRRRRHRSETRLIHIYSAPSKSFKSYIDELQKNPTTNKVNSHMIEEIDGVQFYRTTVPVICKSLIQRGPSPPRHRMRRSTIKIREQPATIILPDNKPKQLHPKARKGKRLFDRQNPDSYLYKEISPGEENEERKKRILEKVESDKENCLSRVEEDEIHERAELFSMSVKPDLRYLSLPEDFSHKSDPAYVASINGQQLEYPLPKKRKGRNIYTDSCYVSYHTPDDPYDNSHTLPCGTKLYRPPGKLVELVADAISNSPDGLLQVPQIYTILMNKYPYFRYMDKTAITSWRSSVRHALFQKWFRKMKFRSPEISSKGCFWCLHSKADISEITSVKIKKRELELDPCLHENVLALLKEEEKEFPLCDIKFPDELDTHFDLGQHVNHFNQSKSHDPVMTTCFSATDSSSCVYPPECQSAILPATYIHSQSMDKGYQTPDSDSSLLVSPLLNNINADTLGIDSYDRNDKNWAPNLPFEYVLESPYSLSQSSTVDQDLESNVGPVSTLSPDPSTTTSDFSSGTSSPSTEYLWHPNYELKEKDLLLYLDDESANQSGDLNLDWGLFGGTEKDDISLDMTCFTSAETIQGETPGNVDMDFDITYLPPTPESDH